VDAGRGGCKRKGRGGEVSPRVLIEKTTGGGEGMLIATNEERDTLAAVEVGCCGRGSSERQMTA